MTTPEQYASFFDEHTLDKSNTFYPYATWPTQEPVVWLYMHQISLNTPIFTKFINLLAAYKSEVQGAMRVWHPQQQGLLLALTKCAPAFEQALCLLLVDKDWGLIENIPDFTQKGLLIMDMDSTAIAMECIDQVAQAYGCGARVQAITEQAMQGHLGFAESMQQRLQCLQGMPYATLETMAQTLPIRQGLPEFVQYLQQKGWSVMAVSGGFAPFTTQLKKQVGLDAVFGHTLAVNEGCLTGNMTSSLIDAAVKETILKEQMQHLKIEPQQVIAIGDGANDLDMLAASGLAIGMHAKPCVTERVHMHTCQDDFDAVRLCFYALEQVKQWR